MTSFIQTLKATHGLKPLDFGNAGLTGSIDYHGRVIAINTYHPRHGYISFSTIPLFTDKDRYDQSSVRAFRRRLAEAEGFGPQFTDPVTDHHAELLGGVIPRVRLSFPGKGTATSTTLALSDGVVQMWQFDGVRPSYWQGSVHMQRCAYTQLTEGGPLPLASTHNTVTFTDDQALIENPVVGTVICIDGLLFGNQSASEYEEQFVLEAPDSDYDTVFICFSIAENAPQACQQATHLKQYASPVGFDNELQHQLELWSARLEHVAADIVASRGIVYGCYMAVPVRAEAVCLLTDHMILPLSWNRDAYYVAKLLLLCGTEGKRLVRQHLIWMFEVAERHNAEWGRCYLANGRLKDPAYQLDQQIFPLLELCDYLDLTQDLSMLSRLGAEIEQVIERLFARKSALGWLFPTDETPADDPIAFDYHFSSHVLLWYTLKRLHQYLPDKNFDSISRALHQDIHHFFVGPVEDVACYAYATDGQGNMRFYHDANDVPLVLAPEWGFVSRDDIIWRNTIKFAFSPQNTDGFYANHLGSVHTPAPWPLGDIQELMLAYLDQNDERIRAALKTIHHAAQWDGALPEAYHAEHFGVISRHWFAWPNALYATVQLEHITNE